MIYHSAKTREKRVRVKMITSSQSTPWISSAHPASSWSSCWLLYSAGCPWSPASYQLSHCLVSWPLLPLSHSPCWLCCPSTSTSEWGGCGTSQMSWTQILVIGDSSVLSRGHTLSLASSSPLLSGISDSKCSGSPPFASSYPRLSSSRNTSFALPSQSLSRSSTPWWYPWTSWTLAGSPLKALLSSRWSILCAGSLSGRIHK